MNQLTNNVTVNTVLRWQDLGFGQIDEDAAIIGFAQKAKAKLLRWRDFAKGALLFLAFPEAPDRGWFCIYDRGRSAFYPLNLPVEGHRGGFREEEFDKLTELFHLVELARNPRLLAN